MAADDGDLPVPGGADQPLRHEAARVRQAEAGRACTDQADAEHGDQDDDDKDALDAFERVVAHGVFHTGRTDIPRMLRKSCLACKRLQVDVGAADNDAHPPAAQPLCQRAAEGRCSCCAGGFDRQLHAAVE